MSSFEPYLPEDFDAFWGTIVAEAESWPLDYHRSLKNEYFLEGFVVETFEFKGSLGKQLYGWFAYPHGARRLPAFLWIPPYGRESLLPNAYGTREGFVSMSFNFHGEGPFYQEKYTPERGYFAEGIGSPMTTIFRTMAKDTMIALRVLQAQSEVDENRIGAMGMSQGGGIAIWMGAFSKIVSAVCADMPFLGAMPYALSKTAYRYPLKEIVDFMDSEPVGRERALHTLSYFDTMNVATRCIKPTHVTLGLKDPACRPEQVEAIYRALSGPKELVRLDWGHDWHPSMINANLSWLTKYL